MWRLTANCRCCVVAALALTLLASSAVRAADPVAVRIENFTVPPATGPLAYVAVKNLLEEPYTGAVSLAGPAGWRIVPAEREIDLAAGQAVRVAFNVEKAGTSATNAYACQAEARGQGVTVVHRRLVCVASALISSRRSMATPAIGRMRSR